MNQYNNNKKWIVYVSTFPPRECGIATFTQDLMNSFDELYEPREEAKVIAMNPDETSQYVYDQETVIYQIPRDNEQHYESAAAYVNSLEKVVLVHVQHEFGIFGGLYGRHIIVFLRTVKKPIAVTFHTVLSNPSDDLREVVEAINIHVQKIIVMTESSKNILTAEYRIAPDRIVVIPHGIHPSAFSSGGKVRKELRFSKNIVISTFGLVSKGKGIEYGIEAMAMVVKKNPTAVYLIIGATHPMVLKQEGEKYRNSLIQLVHTYKLEKHVFFYDAYFELPDLLRFLSATDIYMSLSQDPQQTVSGTLSYALGTGRAVISTSFPQAQEDVTEDVGILVGFKSAQEVVTALQRLVDDKPLRLNMGKSAYFKTRSRTWRNSILRHMNEYIQLVPSLGKDEKNLPKVRIAHIIAMTDSFGMIQFADLLAPDMSSGYTIDDNARALVALVKYYQLLKKKRALPLIQTYLNFIEYVQKDTGGFHNYVDIQKTIHHDQHVRENLESASTKGMYALAVSAATIEIPLMLREKALLLFKKNIYILQTVTSPRSIAYAIKSLCLWNSVQPSPENIQTIIRLADMLVEHFEKNNTADWHWFEDILAYSNGILPEALVDAYRCTDNERYLVIAQQTLNFLVDNSFEGTVCVPIGQKGWMKRGEKKYLHDQQPEEVAALVSCLKAMHGATHDERYAQRMRNAFDWFLGNNVLHRVIYDQDTGGCYDGLGEYEVNLNQGAESTVMYLLARLEFERVTL